MSPSKRYNLLVLKFWLGTKSYNTLCTGIWVLAGAKPK